MLVRQLAYEWGPDGIRCDCVSPGMTRTCRCGASPSPWTWPARSRSWRGPTAAYVTGVNLVVDGGLQTALLPTIRGLVGV